MARLGQIQPAFLRPYPAGTPRSPPPPAQVTPSRSWVSTDRGCWGPAGCRKAVYAPGNVSSGSSKTRSLIWLPRALAPSLDFQASPLFPLLSSHHFLFSQQPWCSSANTVRFHFNLLISRGRVGVLLSCSGYLWVRFSFSRWFCGSQPVLIFCLYHYELTDL